MIRLKLKWFELGERREPEPDLSAMDREALLARLEEAKLRGDAAEISKIYYILGTRCMEDGDAARAILYLCRCDAFAGASDSVSGKLGRPLLDDCAQRLARLGEAPVLTSEIISQVMDRAKVLSDSQVRLWGLLTMARLAKVGQRLSVLQGCQALGRLGQTAKLVLRSLYRQVSPEEIGFLQETCSQIYRLVDSIYMLDPDSQVPAPLGPLEALDLNGGMAYTQLNLYLDNHLRFLNNRSVRPEAGLIPCALLSDYYLRVQDGPLERMPQIQAELRRVQDDQKFLRDSPTRDALTERVKRYLATDILEV